MQCEAGFFRGAQALLDAGQARSEIWIANLRYRDSVEDRVHQVLADRLEAIHGLFGQIPDTLKDVWVQVALTCCAGSFWRVVAGRPFT